MNSFSIRIIRMLGLVCALVLAVGVSARADSSATYKAKCAVCHSDDGSGSGPMGKALKIPDLRSDEVQKQTDAQLAATIANGKGAQMPAYKSQLTEDQIKGLVAYIRSLKK